MNDRPNRTPTVAVAQAEQDQGAPTPPLPGSAEEAIYRLAAIVESSSDAIVGKDLNGIITSWNKGAEILFGYEAVEIVGKSILTLIPADLQHEETEILGRIRRGERLEHYQTVRRRKDGHLLDISLTVSPVRDAQGRIIGASKIARDITEQKRAEQLLAEQAARLEALNDAANEEIAQRRRAEREKELLLNELNHRIKNTLGTIQALFMQTFRTAPRAERDAFVARLMALSEAHDLLTRRSWDAVGVHEVVERAVAPFAIAGRQRVLAHGPDVVLSANKALLLAMALHELGTNAVKYGALSTDEGVVRLLWETCSVPARLRLSWQEVGGPAVTAPDKTGFGTRMIDRAFKNEGGSSSFSFAKDGLRCAMELSL